LFRVLSAVNSPKTKQAAQYLVSGITASVEKLISFFAIISGGLSQIKATLVKAMPDKEQSCSLTRVYNFWREDFKILKSSDLRDKIRIMANALSID
jgi:hypothetical protein